MLGMNAVKVNRITMSRLMNAFDHNQSYGFEIPFLIFL